jgi:hypothetical protein
MFRKQDLFPSSGEGKEASTLLGSLERTILQYLEFRTEPFRFYLYQRYGPFLQDIRTPEIIGGKARGKETTRKTKT